MTLSLRKPMAYSVTIRSTNLSDADAIFSILRETACRVPLDLSTPERVERIKSKIKDYCLNRFSCVAVDKNDAVIGFQLAKEISWLDEKYIHLAYAGVTASAEGKKVFKQLIMAEKAHGLPLVAEVKLGNKSAMAIRLQHYDFRPFFGNLHTDGDFTYRWDPDANHPPDELG